MRKIVHKQVRRTWGGVNVAADLDAVIAINTGDDAEASRTVVRSRHTVVQGGKTRPAAPGAAPFDPEDPPKEKP